jgi:hypothetical protein
MNYSYSLLRIKDELRRFAPQLIFWFYVLSTHLTQKVIRLSPLAPLPKGERGKEKFKTTSCSPSPVLGEGEKGMRADFLSA